MIRVLFHEMYHLCVRSFPPEHDTDDDASLGGSPPPRSRSLPSSSSSAVIYQLLLHHGGDIIEGVSLMVWKLAEWREQSTDDCLFVCVCVRV